MEPRIGVSGRSRLTALAVAASVVALIMAALARTERPAHAWACNHCRMAFGMVGAVPGQTARLNVVNIPESTPQPSTSDPTGPVWSGTLTFVDSNGSILNDPSTGLPAQTSLTLAPGQAGFLEVVFPVGPTSGPGGRLQLRAQVDSADGTQNVDIETTFEIFDISTGKTTTVLLFPHNPG
jgi:hypothetical protein